MFTGMDTLLQPLMELLAEYPVLRTGLACMCKNANCSYTLPNLTFAMGEDPV